MFEDSFCDNTQAPQSILDLYIKQLFSHVARDVFDCGKINPPAWVSQTGKSYKLWLSYARLGVPSDPQRDRARSCRVTECTEVHKERLRKASQEEIDDYIDWVFPKSQTELWRAEFKDDRINSLVSPVHFWFFLSCRPNPPLRVPPPPETPNDMFRHPIFFVGDYKGSPPLVVPEYFFNDHARFDGLRDPATASYYIFPFFAQRLFEYVAMPRNERTTSFAVYYTVREQVWFVPAGPDTSRLIKPHETLRKYWRWEDVLEMLWTRRKNAGGVRPRWCQLAPRGYHDNPRINAYLECFGTMAEIWRAERLGREAG